MQIERIYQPDVQYQLHAILLLLRIRLPHEYSRSNNKNDDEAINRLTTLPGGRKTEDEQIQIEEALS